MSKALFIAGTGTDVGKTYVSGLFLKKLRSLGKNAAYFKAAMSGLPSEPGDAASVQAFAGLSQPLGEMCPYVYQHPVSPHLAARLEANPVEMDVIQSHYDALCARYDYITVEGSGGIVCPLRLDDAVEILTEDLLRQLQLSSLIVADAGLGTINQVVLTAHYMNHMGLPVQGILLNRFHPGRVLDEDNRRTCERLTGLPVIATVQADQDALDISDEAFLALYT